MSGSYWNVATATGLHLECSLPIPYRYGQSTDRQSNRKQGESGPRSKSVEGGGERERRMFSASVLVNVY